MVLAVVLVVLQVVVQLVAVQLVVVLGPQSAKTDFGVPPENGVRLPGSKNRRRE